MDLVSQAIPNQPQRGWLSVLRKAILKCISVGYALYSPAWPEQTGVMLRETRYDALSLVYPGLLDQCLLFTGAAKLTQASFPLLALQAANAGPG